MTDDAAVGRLQTLLRIPTVSHQQGVSPQQGPDPDPAPFDRFLETVGELYPQTYAKLERELVAEHTLVLRWHGRSSTEPAVLLAHYDVSPATEGGWRHPSFAAELSGKDEDQLLWGRGVLRNKAAVASILEAVEHQLAAGLVPAQDIYLVFTHDSETGAAASAAFVDLLASRGISPALVLDEGYSIASGLFPGVTQPVALVGVSERGETTVRLVAEGERATNALARALLRVDSAPFPAALNEPVLAAVGALGSHATGTLARARRHPRLARGPLLRLLSSRPELAPLVRSASSVTRLDAGDGSRAVTDRATATLTLSLGIGTTAQDAVSHLTKAIADDRVRVDLVTVGEAAPVSPLTGIGWEVVRATIEATYPRTIVAPAVYGSATDARHFARVSRAVYRFTPFETTSDERVLIHAKNERMHVASYLRGIEFYRALVAAL